MLIGGQRVPSETGRVLVVTNPATGEPVGEVPEASAADVDKACVLELLENALHARALNTEERRQLGL